MFTRNSSSRQGGPPPLPAAGRRVCIRPTHELVAWVLPQLAFEAVAANAGSSAVEAGCDLAGHTEVGQLSLPKLSLARDLESVVLVEADRAVVVIGGP